MAEQYHQKTKENLASLSSRDSAKSEFRDKYAHTRKVVVMQSACLSAISDGSFAASKPCPQSRHSTYCAFLSKGFTYRPRENLTILSKEIEGLASARFETRHGNAELRLTPHSGLLHILCGSQRFTLWCQGSTHPFYACQLPGRPPDRRSASFRSSQRGRLGFVFLRTSWMLYRNHPGA